MPNIQKLYEKVGSDKIAFVMLSVDEGGMDKVKKFIDKKGYTFPVYMPASQFPQEFYSTAIPTTFIISPQGKIVAKQEGMADYDTKEVREVQETARRLLLVEQRERQAGAPEVVAHGQSGLPGAHHGDVEDLAHVRAPVPAGQRRVIESRAACASAVRFSGSGALLTASEEACWPSSLTT